MGDYFIIDSHNKTFLFVAISLFTMESVIYFYLLRKDLKKIPIDVVFSSFVAFIISVGGIFYIISPQLKEFFWIVFFKTFTLSLLANFVFLNYVYNKNEHNELLFLGIFPFVFANCLFGIYRFYNPANFYLVIVITLYAIGQFLICKSMIIRQKNIPA